MPAQSAANLPLLPPIHRSKASLAAVIATALVFTAACAVGAQNTAPAPHARPGRSASQRIAVPASVFAAPGLECKVHSTGDATKSVTVYTDSDGYARFYAGRATASDKGREMTMDCTDEKGKASTYPVDLTSDETFAPRPLDIEREPGVDRPALTGDPMSYSETELIQAGYGLRPDPVKSPAAYGRWLASATTPGRMLDAKRPAAKKLPAPDRNVVTTEAPFWTGTAITGEPNYLSVEGNISVPSIYVNGDETGGEDVHEAVWNGLGGDGTGSGLIQGGYQIDVTKSVVNYTTFREYCCGDSHSNGYKGDFNPKPGDQVYSEEWYCDKNGNKNLTGGYGCTYLHDLNSGAVLNCVSPTSNQCWSVPALPLCSVNPNAANCMTLGKAAEWVIELQSGTTSLQGQDWVDTADTVTLTGSAYSSKTGSYSQTVTQDPFLTYLADFTGITSTSHMNVSSGSGDETYFNVSQFEQVGGLSHSGALNQVIAVGLNMQGSKIGDPWVLGSAANSNGDYPIYNLVFGVWDKMPGAGTQLAIGPEGYPWVVNHAGVAFYWNTGGWTPIGGAYCASHIAVGPGGTYGTPWILGCNEGTNGYNIYKLENGAWVQQPGQATAIAIGKSGPWIVQKSGNVYYWNGSSYKEAPGNPCATSIAAAPITPFGDSWGDVWTTGCHEQSTGYNIYQLQGNSWVQIPGNATSISISPDLGVPWIVNSNGNIFE